MTPTEIKEKFDAITVWKRGGERAPHKPLLALYAIGRALRGEPRMIEYAEVDSDLRKFSSSSALAGSPIIPNFRFGICRPMAYGS